MTDTTRGPTVGRRRFLQASTVLAAGGGVLAATQPVAAQTDDFTAWFEGVSNYDGVVDERGADTVSVDVGGSGNGGGFAYGPAAVRVDPGTTVVWEWTGEGGSHDVAAVDDAYVSEMFSDAGDTFEHTFDDEGVSRYACTPHESMGMKGAVVVGDEDVGASTAGPEHVAREPDYDDWFDGVPNFDGTVDARGREDVRIAVGEAESGDPVFSPAAVHVDPGMRVVWEWDGDASHSIVAADDSYASPEQSGGPWGLSFDGTGVSKHACPTHDDTMRGAVVVGDVFGSVHDVTTTQLGVLGAVGMAFLSPLAFAAFLWSRGREESPGDATRGGPQPRPRPRP